MAVVPENKVGFECEFVKDPPEVFQSDCPVCLHILREPYQVTCCGKSFCKECIERVKHDRKPCPCCNQDNFNDFPNKGLQQPLYGFKIHCSNKEEGCEWRGELGQLDNHLNLNPQTTPDSDQIELEGCQFVKIKCTYCSDFVPRKQLLHHKNELCDKRPFSCEYCNDYESTYEDVINNHWPVCGHHPVQCPNKCGAFPQRQIINNHLALDCPLTVVECDFNYAGCEIRLPRQNMSDHLRDGLVTHFSMLALSHRQQRDEIQALKEKIESQTTSSKISQRQIQALKEESKTQQDEIQGLKREVKKLKSHVTIAPADFTLKNPMQYTSGNQWSSPHFYSHCYGYKLCIHVFMGNIINTFVFHCYLMQGEFDGVLKQPFRALIKIQMVNKHGEDIGESMLVHFENNIQPVRRVYGDEVEFYGWTSGYCDRLRIVLDGDCLYFRVSVEF